MISFAFYTNDKAYLVTQTTLSSSIMKIKESTDEVKNVNDTLVFLGGHQSDTYRIQMWMEEYSLYVKNLYGISATAEKLSKEFSAMLYGKLRTRTPYEASGIFLGVNEKRAKASGSEAPLFVTDVEKLSISVTNSTEDSAPFYLSSVDNYSTVNQTYFVASNYGVYFLYGIADAYYNRNMTHDESINFINLCIKALKEKLILNTSNWRLDVLDLNKNHETQYIEV